MAKVTYTRHPCITIDTLNRNLEGYRELIVNNQQENQ